MKWFWEITNPPWLVLIPFALFFMNLGLRLMHVVSWQWWVVALPLWASIAGFIACIVFFGIVFGLAWKD